MYYLKQQRTCLATVSGVAGLAGARASDGITRSAIAAVTRLGAVETVSARRTGYKHQPKYYGVRNGVRNHQVKDYPFVFITHFIL